MDKTQLKQNIEEMKQRLVSMEADLAKQISKVWKPEFNEYYYCIRVDGNISNTTWMDDSYDSDLFALGNVYNTKEKAEHAVKVRKAEVRVLRKLRELEGDWEADWADYIAIKYITKYTHFDKKFNLESWTAMQQSPIQWYSTKEAWQWVIDNMEDDLKLILGIE